MTQPRYQGLALLYIFWAVALCSRAAWQYTTRSGNIWPTHLSLLAGCIYIAIAVWAWRGQRRALQVGLISELAGVVLVSIGEHIWPLPYASAWSSFGVGYLWMPILLPLLGLFHLHRQQTRQLDKQ